MNPYTQNARTYSGSRFYMYKSAALENASTPIPIPSRNSLNKVSTPNTITEARATSTNVPFSERFYRAIGPLVGVSRDGSVSSNRFTNYADDVYSGKRSLLPGTDYTGLNRVSRGTTQTWDAQNAADAAKGLGQIGRGSAQALVMARAPGVGLLRSPLARWAGVKTAPGWGAVVPGGGTALGQKILNPVANKLVSGMNHLSRLIWNPSTYLPAVKTISNPVARYATNVAGRLMSPAAAHAGYQGYRATGEIENMYANPMSRGERLTLSAGNYLPNALFPSASWALLTDQAVNSARTNWQGRHLDNLIPKVYRTEEDLAHNKFTPSNYQASTPLPPGYIQRAQRRTAPINIAEGTSPLGSRKELSDLVQHNNRALAEFPLWDADGNPLTTPEGVPWTNRNEVGLHNQYMQQQTTANQNNLWQRFLMFLASVFNKNKQSIA